MNPPSSGWPLQAPGPQQISEAWAAGAVVAWWQRKNFPVPGTNPNDVASPLPLVWLCKYVQGPAGSQDMSRYVKMLGLWTWEDSTACLDVLAHII